MSLARVQSFNYYCVFSLAASAKGMNLASLGAVRYERQWPLLGLGAATSRKPRVALVPLHLQLNIFVNCKKFILESLWGCSVTYHIGYSKEITERC